METDLDSRFVVMLDRTDAILDRFQIRMGIWGGSLLLAIVLVAIVFLYVKGGVVPLVYENSYAALSEAPFDVSGPNAVRNRILAPLIGWVLHLRGPLFVVVPWVFLVSFLTLVNVWSRKEGAGPTLALAITLAIAFSPVIMHSLVTPGWVDGVSYFLLGMALMNVRRMAVSCMCMSMAIMTHEASIFLLPAWLMLTGRVVSPGRWLLSRGLLLAVMLLPYVVYRWWVLQHDQETFSTAFYFNSRNVGACLAVGPLATAFGVFCVFRLHWLLLVIPFFSGRRNGFLGWSLVLIISVCMSLFLAWDTTRMLCWVFPLMVLGGVELGRFLGRDMTVGLLMVAWALNFIVPPYTVAAAESFPLRGHYQRTQDILQRLRDATPSAGEAESHIGHVVSKPRWLKRFSE